MNNLQVILFVVAALVILNVWSRETFVPPVPDMSVATNMFTGGDEGEVAQYPDEEDEVAEYPDEEEVAEYPDEEEEEFGGFDEPVFELSMKKIE